MSAFSGVQGFQSGLRAAVGLVRASVQEKLVYRFDLVIQLLRNFILIFVFRYLWLSLYGSQTEFAGVSLAQTLTYATMGVILTPLFPNTLVLDIGRRLRTGNILFDINRPLYFADLLLYQTFGQLLAALVTSAAPMFVLALFFGDMTLPASPLVWLAFGVSLLLGFLIAFWIDFIVALSGFWLTETWGIFFAKWSIVDGLSGRYLPLWIFPPGWQTLVMALPFRGITYSAMAIFIGQVKPDQIWAELGFQLFWLVALALLGRWGYSRATKHLSVQGG
jgi:ABC-2 type transport system permease protein